MAGESRTAIIDTAAVLFRRDGYDATSWRQIIRNSGAPSGSIAYLFPDGKEQMATAVVTQVAATTRSQLSALLDIDADPATALQQWIQASARILEASGFVDGCPIATIALEMGHRSEPIGQAVAGGYHSWLEIIADFLQPTQGERAPDTAEIILAAFEGALLLSRARRTTRPLDVLAERASNLLAAPQHA